MISASWRGGVTWYNSGDRTVTGHCETPGVGPQAQTHSPPLLHRHLSAELLLLHWAGLCQRQSAGPQDGAALGLEFCQADPSVGQQEGGDTGGSKHQLTQDIWQNKGQYTV